MSIEKDLYHDNSDIHPKNYGYNCEKNNSEKEIFYLEKKESKKKSEIKGLTYININRAEGLILVNSIQSNQYIYDNLFLDEKVPLELKSNSSSFYVKSCTCGKYVLS